jgi:hypothetical protein
MTGNVVKFPKPNTYIHQQQAVIFRTIFLIEASQKHLSRYVDKGAKSRLAAVRFCLRMALAEVKRLANIEEALEFLREELARCDAGGDDDPAPAA